MSAEEIMNRTTNRIVLAAAIFCLGVPITHAFGGDTYTVSSNTPPYRQSSLSDGSVKTVWWNKDAGGKNVVSIDIGLDRQISQVMFFAASADKYAYDYVIDVDGKRVASGTADKPDWYGIAFDAPKKVSQARIEVTNARLEGWVAIGDIVMGEPVAPPWEENRPIAEVKKTIYREPSQGGGAPCMWTFYSGPKLERLEQNWTDTGDIWKNSVPRLSLDNGRTWTNCKPRPDGYYTRNGYTIWEWSWADPIYDPASGLLVQPWNRQLLVDRQYHDFPYYITSADHGRTWSDPEPLRYEEGEDFAPEDPAKPAFLLNNQAQPGFLIRLRKSGDLLLSACLANAPDDPKNGERVWKLGALCWRGRWDAAGEKYQWTAGKRVQIDAEQSSRGLLEADLAELNDGRILVVWRGSDNQYTTGHKWFSLSSDKGMTLTKPAQWKYDDGSPFYSPSSYHRLLRHSVTGKLYWLGNISQEPPVGNSPRYPLIIAEIDEEKAAVKKKTVTVIDGRQPDQPAGIQFSNFSFFENRETHKLEIYLTCYGEDPGNVHNANIYKYNLKLTELSGNAGNGR